MEYRQGIKKLLSLSGWKQFFGILNQKEKIIFFVFLFSGLASFLFLSINFYLNNTEVMPASGGTYREGLVGAPRFLNPVYALAYDVDRDLSELIYSGLMKYNKNGEIVLDLAEEYKILEDGKVFEFYLKENLVWSDGTPLTAEDIVFTVKTIQNPAIKSPIRATWLGVETEKISDSAVRFSLRSPSAVFLENCTLKIMPKHIWEQVAEQNFPFSPYNLSPIGSGPYLVETMERDKGENIISLELKENPNYHGKPPYLSSIVFFFFNNESELLSAFDSRRIDGFASGSPKIYQGVKTGGAASYHLSIPRYFAVFFNPQKAKDLKETEIRQALNYGTDKQAIVNQVLLGQGKAIDFPVLPEIYGLEKPSKNYSFNLEKAEQILEEAGFLKQENGFRKKVVQKEPAFQFKSDLETGSRGSEVEELQKCLAKYPDIYPQGEITGYFGQKTKAAVINFQEEYKEEILVPHGLAAGTGRVLAGTREKLNEICAPVLEETFELSFTLTTANQPALKKAALILKEQWQALGIEIEINTFEGAALTEEIIRPRNYEMILFGQGLGMVPDPFPFWHSSQIRDPGLNLAGYENEEADELLEKARLSLDQEERNAALEEFQEILAKDAPAVFLYRPDYFYLVSERMKGLEDKIIVDPSKRFGNTENWHIRTKRIWK